MKSHPFSFLLSSDLVTVGAKGALAPTILKEKVISGNWRKTLVGICKIAF